MSPSADDCLSERQVISSTKERWGKRYLDLMRGTRNVASHPYISGAGNISQMIGFLRKNFPATVTSETVKKFSIAPNNESYVINALQFIGAIDEDGKRTEKGHDVFLLAYDDFPKAFEGLIREAYKDLFELRGDEAWTMNKKALTSYFRATDKTSEVIGGRQASVFAMFRALAGHEQASDPVVAKVGAKAKQPKPKTTTTTTKKPYAAELATPKVPAASAHGEDARRDLALTVRIEINLPANGSKETYDNIFKSIRANLINE